MRFRVLALSLVASSLLLSASPADAQIGGFLKKKAKDMVKGQTQEAAGQQKARYGPEAWGPAFTETTFAQVLQAYQRQGTKRAQLKAQRAGLVASRDSVEKLAPEMTPAREREEQAYYDRRNQQDDCMGKTLREMEEKQQDRLKARAMSDPAFRQKFMDVSMRMAQAQGQGDQAAVEKIKAEMEKMMGINSSAADSAKARQTCGEAPAMPAWLAERGRVHAVSNKFMDRISKLDEQIAAVAASGSGMDAGTLATAHERLYHWYLVATQGSNVQRFAPEEDALLQKHKDEIVALFKAEMS